MKFWKEFSTACFVPNVSVCIVKALARRE
jgi:hypothetical protein